MVWIALKMLTGERSKYLAIIFGVTFASLLIAEQAAIFCGVMRRTTGQIWDTHGVDIWVMNPNVRFLDDAKPISDDDVYRVRGVPGAVCRAQIIVNGRQYRAGRHPRGASRLQHRRRQSPGGRAQAAGWPTGRRLHCFELIAVTQGRETLVIQAASLLTASKIAATE